MGRIARDFGLCLFVLTSALPSGCGGTTRTGGPGGPGVPTGPVAEQDFARKLASALCTSAAECCQSNGFAYDANTCRTNAEASAPLGPLAPSGSANATFDPAAAGECLDGISLLLSSCSNDTIDTDACARLYVGKLPVGASCTVDAECAPQGGKRSACAGGVCAPAGFNFNPGKLGDPCNGTCTTHGRTGTCSGFSSSAPDAKSCETTEGIYCEQNTMRCTAMPSLGEACSPSSSCAGATFCENGVCVAQRNAGPCSDPRTCSSETYCFSDGTSGGECIARKKDGAACFTGGECLSGSCGSVCQPDVPVNAQICSGALK